MLLSAPVLPRPACDAGVPVAAAAEVPVFLGVVLAGVPLADAGLLLGVGAAAGVAFLACWDLAVCTTTGDGWGWGGGRGTRLRQQQQTQQPAAVGAGQA